MSAPSAPSPAAWIAGLSLRAEATLTGSVAFVVGLIAMFASSDTGWGWIGMSVAWLGQMLLCEYVRGRVS